MRRLLVVVLVALVAIIGLPPLYFYLFPSQPPQLPGPDQRFAVRDDGVMVNAVVKGNGPPIVLVHGLPGSGYDWAPLTDALAARGFQVFAYDRIGYGRSDARPDDDFTIAANASDLLGLLNNQDLHDATVVGWSYGGPVSIEAAGRDASRIGRLVLIGSAGPPEAKTEPPPALAGLIFSEPVLAWLHAVPPAGRAVQAAMSRDAYSGQPEPSWWLPQLAANMAGPNTLRSLHEEGAHIGSGDTSIDPVTVGQPILLLHGDDDRLAPLSNSQWIESHARNADLEVVAGGSHMLPITHTELVADRIAAFARAQASAGAPPPAEPPAAESPAGPDQG
jgi:pimeloyl-ACP methyl ester carboxylesterase